MNEYKVTFRRGLFGWDTKEFYTTAESAEQLQKEIETRCSIDIEEGGASFTIERL